MVAAKRPYTPARRDAHLRSKYGITLEEFERMFEEQGSCCALCSSILHRGRNWAVDHDHSCCPGKKSCGQCIRGILCHPCNIGLGSFFDSVDALYAAIRYLER